MENRITLKTFFLVFFCNGEGNKERRKRSVEKIFCFLFSWSSHQNWRKIIFLKKKTVSSLVAEYLNFSFAFYRFTTNVAGFILRRDNRRQILELFSDSC